METIGLIAAMLQESRALLRCIKEWERTRIGPFRGAHFRILERDCRLITRGLGFERAMHGARLLLAEAPPDLLVSFCIAGAVYADLRIGDVVVATHNYYLAKDSPAQVCPLAHLSKAAWDAATQALQPTGARLLAGTAVTTRGSQVAPKDMEGMENPVLEMETAGIAQVAAGAGLPLVSIRSISDGPGAPIPVDLETIMDENYNFRIGKMLVMVLRRPQILFQARQILRNSGTAADHAARALLAALSQPSPFLSL